MIEFRTLGPIELRHAGGRDVSRVLTQPKPTALLAYLAAANPGGYVRRDALLALLWPEQSESRARAGLSKALHQLRHALGSEAIISRGQDEVALDPTRVWTDITAFAEAVGADDALAALGLYRGEFLSGFHLAGAAAFMRWLDDERMATREAAFASAARAAAAAHEAGELGEAIAYARQATSLVPTDEPALRRLLILLSAAGDRAGAITAYEGFARRLQEELEVEPSPETLKLAAEIRDGTHETPASVPPPARPPLRPARNGIALEQPPSAYDQPQRMRSAHPALRSGLLLAGGAVLLVTLAMSFRSGGSTDPGGRVLVLPFENRSGDRSLDALGFLAADWIADGLARTALAEVVDPVTALFLAEAPPSRTLARLARYGVRHVVTGSFQQIGDSLWFTAQLSEVESGKVIQGIRPVRADIETPLDALDALQRHVVGTVASVTDHQLRALAPHGSDPPTFPAYQEFVAGLFAFRTDVASSVPYFLRAVELDSAFSLAVLWSALAAHHSGQRELRERQLERLERREGALAPLDRLAFRYLRADADGDRTSSFALLEQLATFAPHSVWAYALAFDLNRRRRYADAAAVLERIDPDIGWMSGWQLPYFNVYAAALHELGDGERGVELALERLRRHPTRASREHLGFMYAVAGRVAELEALMEGLTDDPLGVLALRVTAATELHTHGHPDAARNVLRRGLAGIEALPVDVQQRMEVRRLRAEMLYGTGEWARAERLARELRAEGMEDFDLLTLIGTSAARQGKVADAQRVIEELEQSGMILGQHHVRQARIASVLGDHERAIALLEKGVAAGFVLHAIAHGLDWDSIGERPERLALVRPRN